ncbi:hypothetical protein CBR_g31721 [Chara braunii]|uniref:Uncharacterized protein n=1 Tax=Chara braunii TaxID=69332 RepID=A0A388JY08_CHABU|nr:hypothetical protein CBR_g31721 [Chara braunii]|eukprot:GBG62704.1 hypothetical protein CBR_g31721 [Chara braunii]
MRGYFRSAPRLVADELSTTIWDPSIEAAPLDEKIRHHVALNLPRSLMAPSLSTDEKTKMGEAYLDGKFGAPEDVKHAIWWFTAAAKEGDADGQFQLGLLYEQGGRSELDDDDLAFDWFMKAAQLGHAKAALVIGRWFQQGRGPTPVAKVERLGRAAPRTPIARRGERELLEEGLRWFMLAAQRQLPEGQYEVGRCYESGQGCAKKTLEEAVVYYRMASSQGFPPAQYRMGVCYERGEGVGSQDWYQAVNLYRRAAEQGNAEARVALGKCLERGVGGLERSMTTAAAMYGLAAAQENAEAQYLYGLCCEEGRGVNRDDELALAWYRKAAYQGYEPAKEKLRGRG